MGEPVTGSAGPAVGGATAGGAAVVVVGGAVVVVVGARVVVEATTSMASVALAAEAVEVPPMLLAVTVKV